MRSPFLLKATTEGHKRPPSAVEMTVGWPPSITATTLFVVPKSIPMIFPMDILLHTCLILSLRSSLILIGICFTLVRLARGLRALQAMTYKL
jgi:hypothetical protein